MSDDHPSQRKEYGFTTTNYARVRDVLRSDIINGVFKPGDRLKIAELVKRYEISANPIREALQQLQGEGLLEMLPNKGARVRILDMDVLGEWIEVREIMEVFFARRFVDLASNRDIAQLQTVEDELEAAADAGAMADVQKKNSEFHTLIHGVSGNREAIAIVNKNTDLIQAIRQRVGFSDNRIPKIVKQHKQLIRAFEARDAAKACKLMSHHVVDAGNDMRGQYDRVTREQFSETVDSYVSRKRVPKGWKPTLKVPSES